MHWRGLIFSFTVVQIEITWLSLHVIFHIPISDLNRGGSFVRDVL